MNSNKLIPELRFPKFKYEWKLKKFDFNFLQTNTFSRSEMNNNKGSVKNIHYGDILIKYNNILDDTSLIPFINEDINLNRFREESYLKIINNREYCIYFITILENNSISFKRIN